MHDSQTETTSSQANSKGIKAAMTLTMACVNSSRTSALFEGAIGVEGYDVNPVTMPVEEIFHRAFEEAEFHISELSASTYLLRSGRGLCPYQGIPVFPSRAFRHSAIYIRADSDIAEPRDLRGRVIGVRNYLNTCLLYTSPSPRDRQKSRMPSSA